MTDSQKWLIYLLAPVLMPFAFAAMPACLGDPLADKLEPHCLSRTNAFIAVFSVMTLIITLVPDGIYSRPMGLLRYEHDL